jgi:hypothetical protein
MNTAINIESLVLKPEQLAALSKRKRRIPRHKRGTYFLAGPIPWSWLLAAGQLPGKALFAGLCLWFLVKCQRSAEVVFSPKRFGLSRFTSNRALKALESMQLISVIRARGRCPRVTLMEGSDNDSQN